MPGSLTPDEVARYERDGCLFPYDVLDADEVANARRQLEAIEAKLGGPLPRALIAMPNLYAPFVDDHPLAKDPRSCRKPARPGHPLLGERVPDQGAARQVVLLLAPGREVLGPGAL
jgi:hypothetical protein